MDGTCEPIGSFKETQTKRQLPFLGHNQGKYHCRIKNQCQTNLHIENKKKKTQV